MQNSEPFINRMDPPMTSNIDTPAPTRRRIRMSSQHIDDFTYESDEFQGTSAESLVLYKSYSRQIINSDNQFEANVRGWLFQSNMNRKGKIMAAAIERLVGNPSKPSSSQSEEESLDPEAQAMELVDLDIEMSEPPSPTNSNSNGNGNDNGTSGFDDKDNRPIYRRAASTLMDMYSSQKPELRGKPCVYKRDQKNVIRERLFPVFHRSLAMRDVQIMVESQPDINGNKKKRTFWAYTDESGRFSQSCRVPFKPFRAVALSGKARGHAGFVYIPSRGVSVISDIDDTVRHTGVTKSKRELLQNILAKSYDECKLQGVSEWYNELAGGGAHFHYVSNSPWQIYDVVLGFLEHHNFPDGAVHLKKYNGVLDGITEPVTGRKRATLDAIFRDFPDHKFIMIGDSGEADLEAYGEVASKYPNQVLAIYIRDITLPMDESLTVYEPTSPLYGTDSVASFSTGLKRMDPDVLTKRGGLSTSNSNSNSPPASPQDLIDFDTPPAKPDTPLVNRSLKPQLKPQLKPKPTPKPTPKPGAKPTNLDSLIIDIDDGLADIESDTGNSTLNSIDVTNDESTTSTIASTTGITNGNSTLPPLPPPRLPPRRTPVPAPPLPRRTRRGDTSQYQSQDQSDNDLVNMSSIGSTPSYRTKTMTNTFNASSPHQSSSNVEHIDLPQRSQIIKRTSSKIMEGAFTVASASTQVVSRLLGPATSSKDDNVTHRRSRSQVSDDVPNPLVQPHAEVFDGFVDKRVENWKDRVRKHRLVLPKSIVLQMWRQPSDVEESSLDVLGKAKREMRTGSSNHLN